MNIINEKSTLLERDTVGLTEERMVFLKKGKIETCRAHRILRQHNSESLANEILFSKEDLPQSVKESTRHEKAYNEIDRER